MDPALALRSGEGEDQRCAEDAEDRRHAEDQKRSSEHEDQRCSKELMMDDDVQRVVLSNVYVCRDPEDL